MRWEPHLFDTHFHRTEHSQSRPRFEASAAGRRSGHQWFRRQQTEPERDNHQRFRVPMEAEEGVAHLPQSWSPDGVYPRRRVQHDPAASAAEANTGAAAAQGIIIVLNWYDEVRQRVRGQ